MKCCTNHRKKKTYKVYVIRREKIEQTIRKHIWENKLGKIGSYTMRNNRLKDAEIEEI